MTSAVQTEPDAQREVRFDAVVDVSRTVAGVRLSGTDPSSARHGDTVWKARRTGDGPATVAIRPGGPGRATCWAWGPGAEAALADVEPWLGLDDPLEAFDPTPHPVVERLAHARRGVRMGRFGDVFDRLVPTVLGQLVIAKEAKRSHARLLYRYGEDAPGPLPLKVPPPPERIAGLGSHDFHRLGVERRRADTILRLARQGQRLDRLMEVPPAHAVARLSRIRGVGPWTVASVVRSAFADPDAVVLGDYNLPHTVAWALVGKRRSTDEEMLRLLEPFAGHRGRVQMMLKGAGKPPRRGPKTAFREVERH